MSDPHELRRHRIEITVPEDAIDDLGHVNNAVYLQWVEACARDHAARVGMSLARMRELGAVPVARSHRIRYLRPAHAGDRLAVHTEIVSVRGVRATRRNEVRARDDGAVLVEVETEWVWLDPERGRPRPLPAPIAAAFGF